MQQCTWYQNNVKQAHTDVTPFINKALLPVTLTKRQFYSPDTPFYAYPARKSRFYD
jgi:hypothetical protein